MAAQVHPSKHGSSHAAIAVHSQTLKGFHPMSVVLADQGGIPTIVQLEYIRTAEEHIGAGTDISRADAIFEIIQPPGLTWTAAALAAKSHPDERQNVTLKFLRTGALIQGSLVLGSSRPPIMAAPSFPSQRPTHARCDSGNSEDNGAGTITNGSSNAEDEPEAVAHIHTPVDHSGVVLLFVGAPLVQHSTPAMQEAEHSKESQHSDSAALAQQLAQVSHELTELKASMRRLQAQYEDKSRALEVMAAAGGDFGSHAADKPTNNSASFKRCRTLHLGAITAHNNNYSSASLAYQQRRALQAALAVVDSLAAGEQVPTHDLQQLRGALQQAQGTASWQVTTGNSLNMPSSTNTCVGPASAMFQGQAPDMIKVEDMQAILKGPELQLSKQAASKDVAQALTEMLTGKAPTDSSTTALFTEHRGNFLRWSSILPPLPPSNNAADAAHMSHTSPLHKTQPRRSLLGTNPTADAVTLPQGPPLHSPRPRRSFQGTNPSALDNYNSSRRSAMVTGGSGSLKHRTSPQTEALDRSLHQKVVDTHNAEGLPPGILSASNRGSASSQVVANAGKADAATAQGGEVSESKGMPSRSQLSLQPLGSSFGQIDSASVDGWCADPPPGLGMSSHPSRMSLLLNSDGEGNGFAGSSQQTLATLEYWDTQPQPAPQGVSAALAISSSSEADPGSKDTGQQAPPHAPTEEVAAPTLAVLTPFSSTPISPDNVWHSALSPAWDSTEGSKGANALDMGRTNDIEAAIEAKRLATPAPVVPQAAASQGGSTVLPMPSKGQSMGLATIVEARASMEARHAEETPLPPSMPTLTSIVSGIQEMPPVQQSGAPLPAAVFMDPLTQTPGDAQFVQDVVEMESDHSLGPGELSLAGGREPSPLSSSHDSHTHRSKGGLLQRAKHKVQKKLHSLLHLSPHGHKGKEGDQEVESGQASIMDSFQSDVMGRAGSTSDGGGRYRHHHKHHKPDERITSSSSLTVGGGSAGQVVVLGHACSNDILEGDGKEGLENLASAPHLYPASDPTLSLTHTGTGSDLQNRQTASSGSLGQSEHTRHNSRSSGPSARSTACNVHERAGLGFDAQAAPAYARIPETGHPSSSSSLRFSNAGSKDKAHHANSKEGSEESSASKTFKVPRLLKSFVHGHGHSHEHDPSLHHSRSHDSDKGQSEHSQPDHTSSHITGSEHSSHGKTGLSSKLAHFFKEIKHEVKAHLHLDHHKHRHHLDSTGSLTFAPQRSQPSFDFPGVNSMYEARTKFSPHQQFGQLQSVNSLQSDLRYLVDATHAKLHPLASMMATQGIALIRLVRAPPERLSRVLEAVDEWEFDVFELADLTNNRPLSVLAFALLVRTGMVKRFGLDEVRLARFLVAIEEGYPDNPYHNRMHAADVLRNLHLILTRGGVLQRLGGTQASPPTPPTGNSCTHTVPTHPGHLFRANTLWSDLSPPASSSPSGVGGGGLLRFRPTRISEWRELLACYLTAVVHDFEHRGVNNVFLVKSHDPLAIIYNDNSPMENHHVAAAWRVMSHADFDFLTQQSADSRTKLRAQMIAMVLATDMKQHFSILSSFKSRMAEAEAAAQAAAAERALAMSAAASVADLERQHTRSGELTRDPSGEGWCKHLFSVGNSMASNSIAGNSLSGAVIGDNMGSEVGVGGGAISPALSLEVDHISPLDLHHATPPTAAGSTSAGTGSGEDGGAQRPVRLSPVREVADAHGNPTPRDSNPGHSSSLLGRAGSGHAPGGKERGSAGRGGSGWNPSTRDTGRSMQSGFSQLPALPTLEDEVRMLVLKTALKAADLGHLTAPCAVHQRWVQLLQEETFRQGDLEKECGLPVSPLMDRDKGGITLSQPGFFNVVALPLFAALAEHFPGCNPLLASAKANLDYWVSKEPKDDQ